MRSFTNPGIDAVEIPSLSISIAPGETVDIDFPPKVPCPDCLIENVAKKSTAKGKATATATTDTVTGDAATTDTGGQ